MDEESLVDLDNEKESETKNKNKNVNQYLLIFMTNYYDLKLEIQ